MPRLIFSGDVLSTASRGQFVSASLCEQIRNADFSICNLEAPLISGSDAIVPAPKAGPSISQPPQVASLLVDAGFKAVSLANNHMFDFGVAGYHSTVEACQKAGLTSFGAGTYDIARAPMSIDLDGLRISFIACGEAQFGAHMEFDPYTYGYPWINDPDFESHIAKSKSECDFLFLLPHAGLEDYPVPLSEWRSRYKSLCRAGADAIIASHPHVPQGYEYFDGKIIAYSLGNFFFDYGAYKTSENASFSIAINISRDRTISASTICHKVDFSDMKVIGPLAEGDGVDVEHLSRLLASPKYDHVLSQVIESAFENEIRPLFRAAHGLPSKGSSLSTKIRCLLRCFIKPNQSSLGQDLLLLHMIRNESYRWALETAFKQKNSYLIR